MKLNEKAKNRKEALDTALEKGIQTGFIKDFNEVKFLKDINQKYIQKKPLCSGFFCIIKFLSLFITPTTPYLSRLVLVLNTRMAQSLHW